MDIIQMDRILSDIVLDYIPADVLGSALYKLQTEGRLTPQEVQDMRDYLATFFTKEEMEKLDSTCFPRQD